MDMSEWFLQPRNGLAVAEVSGCCWWGLSLSCQCHCLSGETGRASPNNPCHREEGDRDQVNDDAADDHLHPSAPPSWPRIRMVLWVLGYCGNILVACTSKQASDHHHATLLVLKGQRHPLCHTSAVPVFWTNSMHHCQRVGPADSSQLERVDHLPSTRHQGSIRSHRSKAQTSKLSLSRHAHCFNAAFLCLQTAQMRTPCMP